MDFATQLKNRKSATITHINGRPTINHTESTYSNCFFLSTSNKFSSKNQQVHMEHTSIESHKPHILIAK